MSGDVDLGADETEEERLDEERPQVEQVQAGRLGQGAAWLKGE
jgi:hypothetical protein